MSHRVLWINPVGTDAYDDIIGQTLREEGRPDSIIDVASLPDVTPHHLEYSAYEMVMAGSLMGAIRWGEQEGYDAAVIGCFYDPALRGARELASRMAVTAPAEACLHVANTLGERVSILVGRRKWIPEMHETLVRYGFQDRFASWRVLGMTVDQFQQDPHFTEDRILAEARAAVEEDGADVVVLGCTIEFGFYKHVQEEIGVPVVDAITAPLRYAEFLCDLQKHGWSHSKKVGYEKPAHEEMARWIPMTTPKVSLDPRGPRPSTTDLR